MRANVNILTAASERGVSLAVTGYENSAAAHTTNDWGAHNQLLFYATPYAEAVTGHTVANCYLLRILLTGTNVDGTGDAAFTMPAVVASSGIVTGGAPIIIRQPAATTAVAGDNVNFYVKALSETPMTYQWRKNGTNIAGATASTLVLGRVTTADQASYDVIVTNEFGSVTSAAGTLTVVAASAGFRIHADGCFLPDTLITMADGSRKQIKDLAAGDRVLSYSIAGLDPAVEDAWKKWQTASLSATPTVATVKNVYRQSFPHYFQIADLKVTYEHPLLSRRDGIWAFREVQDLRKGDFLWRNGMAIPIAGAVTWVRKPVETYNLNVEETDVYVAQGFMAHNALFKSIWRFFDPNLFIASEIFG